MAQGVGGKTQGCAAGSRPVPPPGAVGSPPLPSSPPTLATLPAQSLTAFTAGQAPQPLWDCPPSAGYPRPQPQLPHLRGSGEELEIFAHKVQKLGPLARARSLHPSSGRSHAARTRGSAPPASAPWSGRLAKTPWALEAQLSQRFRDSCWWKRLEKQAGGGAGRSPSQQLCSPAGRLPSRDSLCHVPAGKVLREASPRG